MDINWTVVTIVGALLAQGAAVVWAVSAMVSDIQETSADVLQMQSRMATYENEMHQAALVVTRIDANLEAIRFALDLMVAAK